MRRALRMPIAIPGAMVAIMGTVVVVMGAGSVVTPVVPVVTPPVTAPEMEMKKNPLKVLLWTCRTTSCADHLLEEIRSKVCHVRSHPGHLGSQGGHKVKSIGDLI